MGARAGEFCQAHPDSNPATAQVATRLVSLVGHSNELLLQHRTSELIATTAVERKNALRESIAEHLGSLAGISRVASASKPDLTVHRRLPRGKASEPTFLSTARVAVAEAAANKEVLLQHGMPVDLLDIMTAELDEFDAVLARQRNAIATAVGANAELESVAREIMGVVRHLDYLHRLRFKQDPDLRAAWKSARNVAWKSGDTTPAPLPDSTQLA
jgi:hypothetical protein